MRISLLPVMLAIGLTFGFNTVAHSETIKSGTIKGQSVKWTTGTVTISRSASGHQLKLGSNFKTKRGPALYVYLGNDKPEKRIGRLKAVGGAQVYSIPDQIDVQKYRRVFIYCVPFQAVFGVGLVR